MKKETGLKTGIMIVFLANIVNFVFRLLLNFLLPIYLNVDVYADYKYYQLLISNIGILHLGYVDGVYLKYGGSSFGNISEEEKQRIFSSLLILELLLMLITITIGNAIHDRTITIAAFLIIPSEMIFLYQYLYQATGEFKDYGKLTSVSSIISFAAISILLLLNVQNSERYMIAYSVSVIIVWLFLQIKSRFDWRINLNRIKDAYNDSINYISSGIFVMLGNFASQFLTSMDRWFIKGLMDSFAFAQYSFAASIETFLGFLVTPFSVTFYNYFCLNRDKETVARIRREVYIFALFIVAAAFPARFILERFIPSYLDSIQALFFLFGSKVFNIVVVCVYLNLYKATKQQKKYSSRMLITMIIGALTNALAYLIYPQKEAFAIATLITTFVSYIISINDFKEYRPGVLEHIYVIVSVLVFISLGQLISAIPGLIIYVVFELLFTFILMKDSFIDLLKLILGRIAKR